MRRLSETSLFWRQVRQSKTTVLGLCLCVAALPAAAIDSSDIKSASPIAVVVPSPPALRAVVASYSAAVMSAKPTPHVMSAKPKTAVPNELIDDHSGHYNGNYAVDARSTRTLDWSCIRNAESHNNYRQVSGAYGILTSTWHWLGESGVPGAASVATQDAFALRIFAANGHRFSGSWNDACTSGGGLG
jgi:hypothetical protein